MIAPTTTDCKYILSFSAGIKYNVLTMQAHVINGIVVHKTMDKKMLGLNSSPKNIGTNSLDTHAMPKAKATPIHIANSIDELSNFFALSLSPLPIKFDIFGIKTALKAEIKPKLMVIIFSAFFGFWANFKFTIIDEH